jgi:L-iditol 2-dehydrogenase/D-arabinitol dehydrogenase (NADP+)
MKALVWEGIGQLNIREVPVPEIGPDDVLVKVSHTGICATDVEIIHGKFPYAPPYILGHEIAGIVWKTGSRVKELKAGDRVVVDPAVPCGECYFCRSGQREFCANYKELGINTNGGWAEYVAAPAGCAHRIPDAMSDIAAAVFEPMACPFGAVDQAGIRPGEQVLIIGDGPAALYFTQIARMMGAGGVYAAYKHPERTALLRKFGAGGVFPFRDLEASVAALTDIGLSGGFRLVIDAVGSAETIRASVRYAGNGARIVLYGFKEEATDQFPHRDVILKGLTLYGRTNSPSVWPRAIQCVARNFITLDPLVERIVTPEEAREILLSDRLRGLKTIIRWAD